ncbi:MAG: hypothetical protein MPN21_18090 [Thermoanaerobaculia bacterium]|nr:hypothetical protein [Thermoanaerobaculia bacterium]
MSDPGFVDPIAGDFHLLATSPAVDRGVTLPVFEDFDGAPRISGNAPDLGPFEDQGVLFADGFETGDLTAWSSSTE